MNQASQLLLTALLMVIVDLPWLSLIGGHYTDIVRTIQGGRQVRMRPLAGAVKEYMYVSTNRSPDVQKNLYTYSITDAY